MIEFANREDHFLWIVSVNQEALMKKSRRNVVDEASNLDTDLLSGGSLGSNL